MIALWEELMKVKTEIPALVPPGTFKRFPIWTFVHERRKPNGFEMTWEWINNRFLSELSLHYRLVRITRSTAVENVNQLTLRRTAFRSCSLEICPSFSPWRLSCPEKGAWPCAPHVDGQLPFCQSSSGVLLSLRPADAVRLRLLPSWCFEAVWPARCRFLAIGGLVWHCLLQHTHIQAHKQHLSPLRDTHALFPHFLGGHFSTSIWPQIYLRLFQLSLPPNEPAFKYTCSEIHASMRFNITTNIILWFNANEDRTTEDQKTQDQKELANVFPKPKFPL